VLQKLHRPGCVFRMLLKGNRGLTRLSVWVDAPVRGVEMTRIIDLDVDIGADAVDYKYVSPTTSRVLHFKF